MRGGITNPNWKVVVDSRAYFVKIPARGTEAFIDRRCAHAASQIAARLGIGNRKRATSWRTRRAGRGAARGLPPAQLRRRV